MNGPSPTKIALEIEKLTYEIIDLEKELMVKRARRDGLQSEFNIARGR